MLYGGAEQVHFHVNEIQLNKLVFTPETYRLNFEVGGTTYDCIIQDIQFHPVTDRIVHIDLLQIMADKPIRVKLPVRTTGTSEGVRNGGRLHVVYRRLPGGRALRTRFPRTFRWTSAPLDIGDSLRVYLTSRLKVGGMHHPIERLRCRPRRAPDPCCHVREAPEGEGAKRAQKAQRCRGW